MRRIVLPCVAATLAALLTITPARDTHAQPVTIAGNFTGQIVSQGAGRCGSGRVTVDILLSGLLSPFGAVTGTQSSCVSPSTFEIVDGLFTLNFVGGGSLFGTVVGQLTPAPAPPFFAGMSTFTITGGTGRFLDATGGGTTAGTQNSATGAITSQIQGTVSAPGLVPEPATLGLVAGGLVALGVVARGKRRS